MTYEELIKEIDEMTRYYHAFSIAIDGPAFAGKRALAAHLSRKFGAPVLHMSDFILPPAQRPAEDFPGNEMDYERYNEEISDAWMNVKELVYTVYDEKGEMKERLALPNAQVYIIEGNFAWHPCVKDFYDLRLFLKPTDKTRAANAAAAGTALDPAMDARLDLYFQTFLVEELADAVLGEEFTIPTDEELDAAEDEG